MSRVLEEYFASVRGSDAHDYSYAPVRDFLSTPYPDNSYNWVMTNPPFRPVQEFVTQAQRVARVGVAVLVRTAFVETLGRYEKMFRDRPPSVIAQLAERAPMVKGRLDPKASTATGTLCDLRSAAQRPRHPRATAKRLRHDQPTGIVTLTELLSARDSSRDADRCPGTVALKSAN